MQCKQRGISTQPFPAYRTENSRHKGEIKKALFYTNTSLDTLDKRASTKGSFVSGQVLTAGGTE